VFFVNTLAKNAKAPAFRPGLQRKEYVYTLTDLGPLVGQEMVKKVQRLARPAPALPRSPPISRLGQLQELRFQTPRGGQHPR
jgi:hypothetical protein